MEAERTLRDELERLQVDARALEAELAVAHAEAFLSQRSAREAELATLEAETGQRLAARDKLRAVVTALEHQRDALADRLRAAEQQRLSLVGLAVVGVLGAVAALIPSLSAWVDWAGPGCFFTFAVVLTPRVVGASARTVLDATLRHVGLPAMVLACAAWVAPLLLASSTLWSGELHPLALQLVTVGLCTAAIIAAEWGEARADAGRGTGRRLATFAGVLAFVPLGLMAFGGVVWAVMLTRPYWYADPSQRLELALWASEALVMLVMAPLLLAWRLDGVRGPAVKRPASLVLAVALSLGALAFTRLAIEAPALWERTVRVSKGPYPLAVAAQLCVAALLFGWRFGAGASGRWRWAGLATAAVALVYLSRGALLVR